MARLGRVLVALVSTLITLTTAAPAQQRSTGIMAEKLQPFVDDHTMAGAVALVATKDKVLDLEAVGFADLAAKRPMATDDIFWIASMSKPLTAAALMMLVDEGKVNVNDPVEKYVPAFHGQMVIAEKDDNHVLLKKPHHPILVREILTHTSGLPFSSSLEVPTLDQLPLITAVRSYAASPLQFEPGSKFSYANENLNTAGRIIEIVSGMPYERFMEERLFKPLGMKDTTFWPDQAQLRRLAKSYLAGKSGLKEVPISQLSYPLDDHKRQPMPAGGLFSTASDLAKFGQMILGGGVYQGKRYLSEGAVRQMTSKQTAPSIPQGYGFGWSVDGSTFGHGGAYKTNMDMDPGAGAGGRIAIFLVQQASDWSARGNKMMSLFADEANKLVLAGGQRVRPNTDKKSDATVPASPSYCAAPQAMSTRS